MGITRQGTLALTSMMMLIPLISGCTNDTSDDTSPTGEPDSFSQISGEQTVAEIKRTLGDSPDDFVNKAIRAEDGSLVVILYGSSSCPLEPESVEVTDKDVLSVKVKEFGEEACTADIGPGNGYKIDSIGEDEVIKSGEVVFPGERIGALNVYAQSPEAIDESAEAVPEKEEKK